MVALASLNALTGGILGINQSQLRTIIAYSSITHLGWITALISNNLPNHTLTYFIIYIILITPIFLILNINNTYIVSQIRKRIRQNTNMSITLRVLLISLGGIPPLVGFFPKLITMYILRPNSIILLLTLIAGSLCNLYFYLNIVFATLTLTPKSKLIFNSITSNKLIKLLTLLSLTALPLPLIVL
jgi:NADH-ubiquinone oxidoreductase chain 2